MSEPTVPLPVIREFTVEPSVVEIGDPATIRWYVENCRIVRLIGTDGRRVEIESDGGEGFRELAVPQSGSIRIEAIDGLGRTASAETPVTVVESVDWPPAAEGTLALHHDFPEVEELSSQPYLFENPSSPRTLTQSRAIGIRNAWQADDSWGDRVRRVLVALVGARYDLLRRTPTDTYRYEAMAGVLLTTATMAAVSAAFALQMAVRANIVLAIIIGIGWGVVILNLDRMLVLGMTRRSGLARNLLAAVPRLALAILLGAVISTPLVLRIFQPEIDAEVKTQQEAQKDANQKQLETSQLYQQIVKLTQQEAADERTITLDPAAIYNNPAVQQQKSIVEQDQNTWNAAQNTLRGEMDGTGGTRVSGPGPATSLDQTLADNAYAEYVAANNRLNQIEQSLRDQQQGQVGPAQADLANVKSQLADRQREYNDQRNESNRRTDNDEGLLARMEALNALSDQRPTLGTAQLALFLLFLSIEVMPVLIKLLHLSGPPTLYERLSDRAEESAERMVNKTIARDETMNDFLEGMRAELEHDRTQRLYQAGLRLNRRDTARRSALTASALGERPSGQTFPGEDPAEAGVGSDEAGVEPDEWFGGGVL